MFGSDLALKRVTGVDSGSPAIHAPFSSFTQWLTDLKGRPRDRSIWKKKEKNLLAKQARISYFRRPGPSDTSHKRD